MWIRHAAVVAVCLAGSAAPAQNFDWCSYPRLTPTARTICSDPVLRGYEVRMNDLVSRVVPFVPDLDQESWIDEREACGTSIPCIERVYRERIADLRLMLARREAPASPGDGTDDLIDMLADLLRRGLPEAETPDMPHLPPPDPQTGAENVLAELDAMVPRPWCGATGLNAAERTICADRSLSRFDALLALTYGRVRASPGDGAQDAWLRERNACGDDEGCIALAYAHRIGELTDQPQPVPWTVPQPSSPGMAPDVFVPPGHRPPPGSCRAWFPGLPPGQQPPPGPCDMIMPPGALLVWP